MNEPVNAPQAGVDTRTYEEFLSELEKVCEMPLVAKLRFLRNARNRDRALGVPTNKLSRLLAG